MMSDGRCNANCPANGCGGKECALDRFVAEFPHLIIEQRDNPHVCKRFRKAAERLELCQGYRDFMGRILFVSDGISNGSSWMTFYNKPNGSLRRVNSKFLPIRETREAAQRDLDKYAKERGLEAVPVPVPLLKQQGGEER